MIKLINVDRKKYDILKRLLQLYLHDISIFFPIDFNSKEGLYLYDDIDKYFDNTENYAYFIMNNDEIAGFVLADKVDSGMVIQEFFVMNNYKRSGIGKKIAFELFDKFKGNWIVKSLPKSMPAENFWNNVIKEYTSDNFKIEHIGRYNRAVFEFDNKS